MNLGVALAKFPFNSKTLNVSRKQQQCDMNNIFANLPTTQGKTRQFHCCFTIPGLWSFANLLGSWQDSWKDSCQILHDARVRCLERS